MSENKEKKRRWIGKCLLMLWAPSIVTLCAYLLSGHLLSPNIPKPDDPVLTAAIVNHQEVNAPNRWMVVHVLSGTSLCSKKVAEHLFSREGFQGIQENVLLIEPLSNWESEARSRNMGIKITNGEDLRATYNITAAPMIILMDPEGKIRYAGGYFNPKYEIEDIHLIQHAVAGTPMPQSTTLDCADRKSPKDFLSQLKTVNSHFNA